MSPLQSPPRYQYEPIRSLSALSRKLGIALSDLQAVAARADQSYRLAKPIVKPDGSIRQPFDAKPRLKAVQIRIKERILDAVWFPDYLTGSLKGKDTCANAQLHAGASLVLCEDVAGFFPDTTSMVVLGIWRGFFGFSLEVSELLTRLTTKDCALPQGAVTSSHLANLAFWRDEHELYTQFHGERIAYSRYVDDIAVSSVLALSGSALSNCISRVYTMMGRNGYRPKRAKQEIQRGNAGMLVTKLLANVRVALPKRDRRAIRSAVHRLEVLAASGAIGDVQVQLNSVSGQVARLQRLHPKEGAMLRARLKVIRGTCVLSPEQQSADEN